MFQRLRGSDFLRFLRRPYLNDGTCAALNIRPWIGWVGVILLADMVVAAMGRGVILALGHKPPPDKAIMHLISHPSWMVLAILLLAPILEELTFRAFLSRNRFWVFLGSGMFLAALGRMTMLMVSRPETTQMVFSQYLLGVATLVPLLAAYGVVWWLAGRWIMALFQRFPVPIFWLSCLVFGAAHSLNFETGVQPWLLLLTLPQISAGIFLGYIRVRHGLRWSIATHMAIDYTVTFAAWALVLAKPVLGAKGMAVAGIGMFLLIAAVLVYGMVGLARARRLAV
jgi:hypothetical protein